MQQRDDSAEAAFAALVDRHGGMVLRVCRQVLGDDHDAQDASQATFLVLARRAGSLGRHESIGCWLHGVALRIAAKARVAAARRRVHEQRGAAMAAERRIEEHPTTPEDRERWASLHKELGRLPDAFRAPLVLCYLEGLTQEQAAARLDAPLGTIQSRLARGRAKLKARLERRGVDASMAIPGAAFGGTPSPAPAAWVEATVRLTMRFTHGSAAKGAAGCMSAYLAEKVLRAMMIGKIKVVVGMIVFATFLAVGAMTWARQDGKPTSPTATVKTATPPAKPQEASPTQPEPARQVTRTVHGIVRDELGRPVAKAWVGPWVEPMTDLWLTIISPDRIRVASKPYLDPKGNAIPPGPLGKLFEYRDDAGKWQPVAPNDIRRRDPRYIALPDQLTDAEKAQPDGLLEVRLAKGRQRMSSLFSGAPTAARTDSQGRFAVEISFSLPDVPADQLHVASPDFQHQALRVVRADGPDQPLEITLKPTRLVRARVVETPKDYPRAPLSWQIYSVDPARTNTSYIYAISGKGALWSSGSIFPEDRVPAGGKRQLEVQLSAGPYKVVLDTYTTYRVIDLVVPEGEGPLELPEIDLANFAWVKMLGRPAAEIEATDLQGRPVKLADYRGKVVLLTFGVAWDDRPWTGSSSFTSDSRTSL